MSHVVDLLRVIQNGPPHAPNTEYALRATCPETHILQRHTAAHCNTLQHTATHCNTLQHTETHCNTLQHTATHCNTLQHTLRPTRHVPSTQLSCSVLQFALHVFTLCSHCVLHCVHVMDTHLSNQSCRICMSHVTHVDES